MAAAATTSPAFLVDSSNLQRCLSASYSRSPSPCAKLKPGTRRAVAPPLPMVRQRRRRRQGRSDETPSADGSPADMERVLLAETAVARVGRRAASVALGSGQTSSRLWPRAVLTTLDDAIANRRWKSALEVFVLLRKQRWYQPCSRTYARLLAMLGKCRRPDHAAALFQLMLSEGHRPTPDVYTALAGAYALSGHIDAALAAVDEMKAIANCQPDAHTYTVLIDACCKTQRFDSIPALLSEMKYLGLKCGTATRNAVIAGYGKAGMLEDMERSLSDMLDAGNGSLPDVYTMNSVVGAYGDAGMVDVMERQFEEFQLMGVDPDARTLNILIKAYGKAARFDKLKSVLDFMEKRFFAADAVTFNTILCAFGAAGDVRRMEHYFRVMKMHGVKPNRVTYCAMVSGYGRAGRIDKVSAIIRQTENTDVALDTVFFNAVIAAYGRAGEVAIMEEMFELMKRRSCEPDGITVATMARAYETCGMTKSARALERVYLATEGKPKALEQAHLVTGQIALSD